jgi:hypothetical protein
MTKNSYWNRKGKFQVEYQRLWDKLVPAEGEADTIHGKVLCCAVRIYNDIFNNGGDNIRFKGWVNAFRDVLLANKCRLSPVAKKLKVEKFGDKLKAFVKGKSDYKTCDQVVDVVVKWVEEMDRESLAGLTREHPLAQAAQTLLDALKETADPDYPGEENTARLQLEIDKLPSKG